MKKREFAVEVRKKEDAGLAPLVHENLSTALGKKW